MVYAGVRPLSQSVCSFVSSRKGMTRIRTAPSVTKRQPNHGCPSLDCCSILSSSCCRQVRLSSFTNAPSKSSSFGRSIRLGSQLQRRGPLTLKGAANIIASPGMISRLPLLAVTNVRGHRSLATVYTGTCSRVYAHEKGAGISRSYSSS